jgi:hypothetical protein
LRENDESLDSRVEDEKIPVYLSPFFVVIVVRRPYSSYISTTRAAFTVEELSYNETGK